MWCRERVATAGQALLRASHIPDVPSADSLLPLWGEVKCGIWGPGEAGVGRVRAAGGTQVSVLLHILILMFQESKDLHITKDISLYVKAYATWWDILGVLLDSELASIFLKC